MAVDIVLLISIADIKKHTIIDDNVDDNLLIGAIDTAQNIKLPIIIGENLYNKLINLALNKKLNDPENVKYKELKETYIFNYLKQQTLAESILPLTYKLRSKGVVTNSDNSSGVSPVNMKDAQTLINFYEDSASFYGKRLVDYLEKNSQYFPEYKSEICNQLSPKSPYNIGINTIDW